VRNADASGTGKFLYLDYLRMTYVTAPTGATQVMGAVVMDNANRVSAGATSLTPVNSNMASSNASIANVSVGAITATAASGSVRPVGRFALKTAIPVVGDSFVVTFGDTSLFGAGLASVGPVLLGPGQNHSAVLHLWLPGQSAAGTVELELGWWER
jgi:hypothetical protein